MQASMVSNPVSFCTDPQQSGSGIKKGTHVSLEQTNVNDTDTSEVTASTAPVPQGIEVHRTEVCSQGSVQVTKTQLPSVDGCMHPKQVSTLVGSSDTSEVSLSTVPVPQGTEIHSTELNSRASVEVIKTQIPSVDGSMYPKEVPTLVESSDTNEVTSSSAPMPEGIEVHGAEVYSRGSVKVVKTQSPSIDGLVHPKEVSTLAESSDTNEVISSTAPVPQGIEVHSTASSQGSVKVIETQSPSVDATMYPKEVSTLVLSSELIISAKNKSVPPERELDQAQNPENQGPLERTPSNVRKMISAFESSRSQDTRPDYKSTTIKLPSSKVGVEAPLKEPHRKAKEVKPTQVSSVKVTNPFLKEESRQRITYFKKRGEQLNPEGSLDESESSQQVEQLKELSTEQNHSRGTNSSLKDEGIAHNNVAKKESIESYDVIRESTVEEATIAGQILDEHLVGQQPANSFIYGVDSGGTSAIMGSARDIHLKVAKKEEMESPDVVRVSTADKATVSGQMLDEHLVRQQPTNSFTDGGDYGTTDKLNSLDNREDEQYSRKNSSAWIFPEEVRHMCVTTGCSAEATTFQGRMRFSAPQHVEEHRLHSEKTFCKPRESDLDNSAVDANRRGPVGQAIKIAIMVGFGTLVLLTRQRKNR